MAKLWSLLRNRQLVEEKRFTLDDYVTMLQNSPYPIGFMNRNISNAYEDPDEEFQTEYCLSRASQSQQKGYASGRQTSQSNIVKTFHTGRNLR